MAEPIVFISRFRVREGKRQAIESMFAQVVDVIGSTKPRTALYAAYLDETATELQIVHVFPDAGAIEAHFEGSKQRSQAAYELIAPAGFEIYGRVPPRIIGQLRYEAAEAGVGLDVLPDPIGGFVRAPG